MEQQVLLDKLSEFLMVEQGGLELYRVAAGRCTNAAMKRHYQDFGKETMRHREILVRLIEQLGGDPSYISPTARLAQVKTSGLLEATMKVSGLSQQEKEANDLENLLLAETKDHSDWHLLQRLVEQVDDAKVKAALQGIVAEVEQEEDTHLSWARDTLGQHCLEMILKGPAPSPERWMSVTSGPVPPIEEVNPAPVKEGLLPLAKQPAWQDSPSLRAVRAK